MQSIESKILYNDMLAEGYFRLGLEWKTPEVKAGHFVMLRVSDGMDPLLRRPFGVYRVIGAKGKASKGTGIELLYRVVGRGTSILSAKRPGEVLGILGPLGNGFPAPRKKREGRDGHRRHGHRAPLHAREPDWRDSALRGED